MSSMNRVTPVGIRINPGVDANTHSKISTGKIDSKFGLSKSKCLFENHFWYKES